MGENKIKPYLAMRADFEALNNTVSESNRRPAPLANLFLRADHPVHAPTYELLEGSLRYYPLELEDVMRSDRLRAHYKCYAKNATINTRFDREELQKQEKLLRPFEKEIVASWNLVQLRAAIILIDNAPSQGRAVRHKAIEVFRAAPHSFYGALTAPPTPGLH